jgi:hypothetical protein
LFKSDRKKLKLKKEKMRLSFIATTFVAYHVTALQLRTTCDIREKAVSAALGQYSPETISAYIEGVKKQAEESGATDEMIKIVPLQFNGRDCFDENICTRMSD